MRTLIDGYNLMYALGVMTRRFGPDGLRKARHRFLNDLAALLEPVEAHLTTVVFDASSALEQAPPQTRHKGLTVIFAVGDENADARLERLIAGHSAPKGLTVVSSDHRVRDAASRRKANVLAADTYWDQLQERRRRRKAPPASTEAPTPTESAYWQEAFRDVSEMPEAREVFDESRGLGLTDEEIARIEREVEEEFS